MRWMETGIGRNGTLDGRTLETTRTWEQAEDRKGGKRTGEGRHRLHEEILWAARNGREAQTSGDGQRAGAPYRWKVAPRRGKRGGGRSGCKERENRRRRVKDGGRYGIGTGGGINGMDDPETVE